MVNVAKVNVTLVSDDNVNVTLVSDDNLFARKFARKGKFRNKIILSCELIPIVELRYRSHSRSH